MSFDLATYKAEIADRKRRLYGTPESHAIRQRLDAEARRAASAAEQAMKPEKAEGTGSKRQDAASASISAWIKDPTTLRASAKQIIRVVAAKHGLSPHDIIGNSRRVHIIRARHEAIYLVRLSTRLSLLGIGRVFNRDHTTVLNSVRRHQSVLDREPAPVRRTICPLCHQAVSAQGAH